ncbi:MAG: hypothetical protein OXH63_22015 [Gemmatimonadetes bacterium]|nr:hypothetical protein [Gemmatimonadota bacterium]
MRLYHTNDEGLIIQDRTCMTACPTERGVWLLAEWRIMESVPLTTDEEGFELATWGEARRRKWTAWAGNPCYM